MKLISDEEEMANPTVGHVSAVVPWHTTNTLHCRI